MFETFKEKYDKLEKKYDQKEYAAIVREGGIAVESLMAYIFRNFPSTMKTIKQKQLYCHFEKEKRIKDNYKFDKFIDIPTIGVSIGYYNDLCKLFKDENHPWLKIDLRKILDKANEIRNNFSHDTKSIPNDDDAADLLDSFGIIIEELNLQNVTPESLGCPLSTYLIYESIMQSFDNTAEKEEDWKKIIADSKKIIPQLLEHLFYSKYYKIPMKEKELIFANEGIFSIESEDTPNSYEEIFKKLDLKILLDKPKINFIDLISSCISQKVERYSRSGVRPFTKFIKEIVNSLIGDSYEQYYIHATKVKDKYLKGNNISDEEEMYLLVNAENLNLSPEIAARIEQEVIRIIDNELTLYQTLKSTEKEDEADTASTPVESMLINMIKAGAAEDVVIKVAEDSNFKGDIYHLLSKYSNRKSSVKSEKFKENSIPKNEEKKNGINKEPIKKTLFKVEEKEKNETSENDSTGAKKFKIEGIEFYKQKDYKKAVINFSDAIKLEPNNVVHLRYRGTSYYFLEDYDNAIQDFSEAIKLRQNDAFLHNSRGICYYNLNNFSKSIQDFDIALQIDPSYNDALNNKKKSLKKLESEKTDKLGKATEYNLSGIDLYNKNDYPKAILDFSKAIQLNPTEAVFLKNRGNSYYALQDYKNAVLDYSEALKIIPEDAELNNTIGICYYNLKEFDKAIINFEKALLIDPKNNDARNNKNNTLKKIEENRISSTNSANSSPDQSEQDLSKIFTDLFGVNYGKNTDEPKTKSDKEARDRNLKKDSDLEINVPLTLEEISQFTIKEIKINKYVKCQICDGSGAKAGAKVATCLKCSGSGKVKTITKSLFGNMQTETKCDDCAGHGTIISNPCEICKGEGRVKNEQNISITIPAGVSDGQYLRIKGNGDAGKRGGESGDLLCILDIADHSLFQRDGNDIHYELIIKSSIATSGGEMIVPTLYGKVKLKINQGIESGKILRLRGKGLPILNETGKGDMFATVKIQPD